MLFISYYELSNDVETQEVLEAGNKLMEAGMWPPEGMEIIRWDTTADGWGVSIVEADDYETLYRAITMWQALVPGIFKEVKTSPASTVENTMSTGGVLLEELAHLE